MSNVCRRLDRLAEKNTSSDESGCGEGEAFTEKASWPAEQVEAVEFDRAMEVLRAEFEAESGWLTDEILREMQQDEEEQERCRLLSALEMHEPA